MSLTEIVIEGTIQPDATLVLAEKLNLPAGRVQVIVQSLPATKKDDPFRQRMQARWDTQEARGHVARSVAEVEAERRQIREDWDERMQRIDQVRVEAEAIRKARGDRRRWSLGRRTRIIVDSESMAKQLIKQAVPGAVIRQIQEHVRRTSLTGESGWKNAPTSEDTLTGHWGGALATEWSDQTEAEGYFWRWRVQYRKLGGNQHASEEKPTGSDGVFQIEVDRFKVAVLPALPQTVSLENVELEYSFRKGILFQSKRFDSTTPDKLLEEVSKIEKLAPCEGAYFEYGPKRYRACLAKDLIRTKGLTKTLELARLGDFLADHFLECLVGVEGLYVDLDSEPQTLIFPQSNDAVRNLPTRLGHALRVQVTAFKMVRFERG